MTTSRKPSNPPAAFKAVVDATALRKALNTVKPAVAAKAALPVLAGVKLTASSDALTLTATNLDLWAIHAIDADVPAEGEVIVPFRSLAQIVKGKGLVALVAEEDTLRVSVGPITHALPLLPLEEAPRRPEIPPLDESIPVDVEALRAAATCAGTDANKPILNSVLFAGDKIVATDSYRLAVVTTTGTQPECLVPYDTIEAILASKQEVTFTGRQTGANREQAHFQGSGGTQWISILTDGEFVPYEQLIDRGHKVYALTFDRKALLTALLSLAPVYRKVPSEVVTLAEVDDAPGGVTLSTGSLGESSALVTVPVEKTVGPPARVAYNGDFLADILGALTAPTVTIEFDSPQKPAYLSEVDPEGRERLFLLMPVRV